MPVPDRRCGGERPRPFVKTPKEFAWANSLMFYERTTATANAGGRSLTEPCFKVGDAGVFQKIGTKRIDRSHAHLSPWVRVIGSVQTSLPVAHSRSGSSAICIAGDRSEWKGACRKMRCVGVMQGACQAAREPGLLGAGREAESEREDKNACQRFCFRWATGRDTIYRLCWRDGAIELMFCASVRGCATE